MGTPTTTRAYLTFNLHMNFPNAQVAEPTWNAGQPATVRPATAKLAIQPRGPRVPVVEWMPMVATLKAVLLSAWQFLRRDSRTGAITCAYLMWKFLSALVAQVHLCHAGMHVKKNLVTAEHATAATEPQVLVAGGLIPASAYLPHAVPVWGSLL